LSSISQSSTSASVSRVSPAAAVFDLSLLTACCIESRLYPVPFTLAFAKMKLYITPGSPYARMARIVVMEKGLQGRVEIIIAKTRAADSPYYAINPSGRVPYLVRDDGVGMEESALICDYLDHLDGKPAFTAPGDPLEARRLEALARSLVDGLSVWGREITRPRNEQSPGVIEHEKERARRMCELWEREIEQPAMQGKLNMIQFTLGCALGLAARNPGFRWRAGRPKLARWYDEIAARRSFVATAPPPP
jgi:glutathione S-transferase